MIRSVRILTALGAVFFVSLALAACGGGVPGNAVVRVGDSVIKKSEFNRWLAIAARSSQPPGQTAKAVVPDPPKFTKCAAEKRKSTPKVKGQPTPSTAQMVALCKQEYESVRDQVVQFLVSVEWVQGEAKDQGIKLSDKDVQKEFDKQRKQSFPKPADFEKFLKRSGYTKDDLLVRVRFDLATTKLREKATKGKGNVSDAQIAAYYMKNKSRFAQPERRDLQVVLTKTKAKAGAAKAQIRGGSSFSKVAKKSSIDQASKASGGKLLSVTKGQQEKAFDTAIFAAKRGQLLGPVKTQFGFYIFRVTKIVGASQQSLAQAKESIRQLLKSQNEQQALDKFVKKFEKKWKKRTDCRKGFVVQTCKNFKKPKGGTSGAQGAPPSQQGGQPQQGGQSQQVPPQP